MSDESSLAIEGKRPILVMCRACKHVWPGAWTPGEMGAVATQLQRASCPACYAEISQLAWTQDRDAHLIWIASLQYQMDVAPILLREMLADAAARYNRAASEPEKPLRDFEPE